MKELHKAMYKFWSQFSYDGQAIPAFPSGRVPDGQPFPYLTFTVSQGSFFSTSIQTAFVWCQKKKDTLFNVQAQRAEIMDQVAQAIPEAGARIAFEGGVAILYRNPTNFLSYYDPVQEDKTDEPTAEPVIGGRIGVEMRIYSMKG